MTEHRLPPIEWLARRRADVLTIGARRGFTLLAMQHASGFARDLAALAACNPTRPPAQDIAPPEAGQPWGGTPSAAPFLSPVRQPDYARLGLGTADEAEGRN